MPSERDDLFDSASSGPGPSSLDPTPSEPATGEIEFDLADSQQRGRAHFWRALLESEKAPWTDPADPTRDVAAEPVQGSGAAAAAPMLSEVARSIAARQVFLDRADQLSDPQFQELRLEPIEESSDRPPAQSSVAFCSQEPIRTADEAAVAEDRPDLQAPDPTERGSV